MEIIELPGYLTEEKLHIAEGFLIPKQIKEHGHERGWRHDTQGRPETLLDRR